MKNEKGKTSLSVLHNNHSSRIRNRKKDEKLENRNETSAMIHEPKSSEMKFN